MTTGTPEDDRTNPARPSAGGGEGGVRDDQSEQPAQGRHAGEGAALAPPHMRRRVLLGAACVLLGLATTIGVAWGSSFIPVDLRTRSMPSWLVWGTLGSDGDHKEPWNIEIRTPASRRAVFFEKARIYFVEGAGPPGARSESVNCWSYAINVVRADAQRFAPGRVAFAPESRALIERTPWEVWGLAEDERGFPFPALSCRIVGTLDKLSPVIYVVEGGVAIERPATAGGSGESLETLRVLPYRPLWAGLAANTLVYSVLWAGVLALCSWTLSTLSGARAISQGRCGGCGYDLRGVRAEVCPECGRAKIKA